MRFLSDLRTTSRWLVAWCFILGVLQYLLWFWSQVDPSISIWVVKLLCTTDGLWYLGLLWTFWLCSYLSTSTSSRTTPAPSLKELGSTIRTTQTLHFHWEYHSSLFRRLAIWSMFIGRMLSLLNHSPNTYFLFFSFHSSLRVRSSDLRTLTINYRIDLIQTIGTED